MNTVNNNAAILGRINSLVAFFPGLSAQEKSDIQNVLLYAQSFASQTYDFERSWHSWMHYYRNRLEARGFQLQSLVTGDSEIISSVDDLARATFRVHGASASAQLADLVRRSVAAMGINRIVTAYFEGGIDSGNLGSFQIVPCEKTPSGDLTVLLCGLHLSVDGYSAERRRLVFHFKGGSYRCDPGVYAAHRKSVSDYLRNNPEAYFKNITL
ncbi:hypothetical protein [Pseudomonas sp. NA-150]|uniref:hypothetical protein n=1 Tax=Pseudomonas sp. NA-150 TaxID=3367525 RepID=UPI0037C8BCD8